MEPFVIILLTLILSAFFSGSEIAFVSANRLKAEIETRKPHFTGRAIDFFVRNPETFLTTTLVGNNIINVLYATLMAFHLKEPLRQGIVWLTGAEPGTAIILTLQTIIASLVVLIVGEIIPKSIFRAQSDMLLKWVAAPLRVVNVLLRPVIWLADMASQALIRRIGVQPEEKELIYRRQDLEMLFKELRDAGGGEDFDKEDSEILHNVLELSEKRVKESMVPRTEIVAVSEQAELGDVLQTFISSGYSKLPVFRETVDNIIGAVFAYDMFSQPDSLKEIIRPVMMIPASKKARDLLGEFRQSNTSLAVVIDEYGGTAGLITAEDLIEEVVGDIQDEYDTEEAFVRKLTPNAYMITGSYELEDLMERHPEIAIPFDEDSDYETLAGFIIHMSGRIPRVNEELVFSGIKFIISKATPSRIDLVKVILITES
jgi:putative hemolysin